MNTNQPDMRKKNSQHGLTLVEMAMVMVIAGLLLGSGILMGQSLIRGVQAKELMALISDISTGVRYFKEKYHYLPGDLPQAANDIPGIDAFDASGRCDYQLADGTTVGNGLINITVIADRDLETECLVDHLVWAGFLKGIDLVRDPDSGIRNRFGAVRIVANSAVAAGHSNVTLPADILNVIELENLPWDIVQELDRTLDNGNPNTGNAQWDADPGDDQDVAFYALPL